MEKRLAMAMALSLIVLLSWSSIVSKLYHVDNKQVKAIKIEAVAPASSIAPAAATSAPLPEKTVPSQNQNIIINRPKAEFTFEESKAVISEVKFQDQKNYIFPLGLGFWINDSSLLFKKIGSDNNSVSFVYQDSNKEIIKRFIFSNTNHIIELEIEIKNLSAGSMNFNSPLVLGILDFAGDQNEARFKDIAASAGEKVSHPNSHKDSLFADLKFLSLRDRYFAAIIEPVQGSFVGSVKKLNPTQTEVSVIPQNYLVAPNQSTLLKFRIYLGPQELSIIQKINPDWLSVMYFGTFDFVAHFLLQLLNGLFGIVHNWGLTIVLFSILIYLILYPLSLKQMRSMKEMQALQPKIEALRKQLKDNPQKLNKEIMELYREHKVNPFGGCLPLLLQIPVFFALYQVLMRSVALKGAGFLWIKDLSEPDRLFVLGKASSGLPIVGNEFNLLPILMAIEMFLQQKLSMGSATVSSEAAQQQKIMLIVFPIMFGIIFYRMPSGLVLYWFINSSFMLLNQLRMNRVKK